MNIDDVCLRARTLQVMCEIAGYSTSGDYPIEITLTDEAFLKLASIAATCGGVVHGHAISLFGVRFLRNPA